MRDRFIQRLTDLCETNPNLMLITGDLGFGVLTNFQKKFPKQYLNAGIAEQNMTGLATGLGLSGKTVFTYSIGNFCTLRCLEQIRNDACYHEANVTIVSVGGGFSYGQLGYSHHATEDLSILRVLPNIRVFSPCDFWETEEITSFTAQSKGVNYIRIDKSSAGYTQREGEKFEVGKARVLHEGSELTIIATGGILGIALQAAEELFTEGGVSIKVVSMHTIKPIDKNIILKSAIETGGIITLEEHTIEGGLGSAVAEVLMDNGVSPKSFYRMGLRAGFSTIVGSQDYLRKSYNMDVKSIKSKVYELIGSKVLVS
jgi:transketolase